MANFICWLCHLIEWFENFKELYVFNIGEQMDKFSQTSLESGHGMIEDIYDYCIIDDLYTFALIGKDGSMDWLCLPYLDSPSVFGFLLDADLGGRTLGGVAILAEGKHDRRMLSSSRKGLKIENNHVTAKWDLTAGERVGLNLRYNENQAVQFDFVSADQALHQTRSFWRDWPARSETGQDLDLGPFEDMVDRSTLVWKLLEFLPSGAIAAAATTSLPEQIGGVCNWDYRFSWIKDSAWTIGPIQGGAPV